MSDEMQAAFKVYLCDVQSIVSTLESLEALYVRLRSYIVGRAPTKRIEDLIDSFIEGESAPIDDETKIAACKTEIASLRAQLDEKTEALEAYRRYGFNLERFIAEYALDIRERYILYVLTSAALYDESPSLSIRDLSARVSIDGELYLENAHYLSASEKLFSLDMIIVVREPFGDEAANEFLGFNVMLASRKLLFAFMELSPWEYLQSLIGAAQKSELVEHAQGNNFESIIETTTPKSIVKELDRYVIGQERAKRALAVQAYLHYVRVKKGDTVPNRSNIMMVGPTGVGKTYLAEKLADTLALPFVRADVTTLTETGYVGDDVELVLHDLLRAAGGDVALAEKGIVFFDEVDKIAKRDVHQSTTGNPSDKAVQEALLSMLNGEDVRVPESGDRRMMHGTEGVVINTRNILFIFGGAFVGLEDIIRDRLRGDQSFGFNATMVTGNADRDALLRKVDVKDLEKYGMIPEFLGRIPITVALHKLGVEELKSILMKSADSPLVKYYEFFKSLGKKLIVSDAAVKAIVDRAIELDMGARSLKHIVENVMVDILYHFDSIKEETLCVTKKLVRNAIEGIDSLEPPTPPKIETPTPREQSEKNGGALA